MDDSWPDDCPIQTEDPAAEGLAQPTLPLSSSILQACSGNDIHAAKASRHPRFLAILPGQLTQLQASSRWGRLEQAHSAKPVLTLGDKLQFQGRTVPTTSKFLVLKCTARGKVTCKAVLDRVLVFGDAQHCEATEAPARAAAADAPIGTEDNGDAVKDSSEVSSGLENEAIDTQVLDVDVVASTDDRTTRAVETQPDETEPPIPAKPEDKSSASATTDDRKVVPVTQSPDRTTVSRRQSIQKAPTKKTDCAVEKEDSADLREATPSQKRSRVEAIELPSRRRETVEEVSSVRKRRRGTPQKTKATTMLEEDDEFAFLG